MHNKHEDVDMSKCLEGYVNMDFTGYHSPYTTIDAADQLSRTDTIIMLANLPIDCRSSLQTEIMISSALLQVLLSARMTEEINSIFPLHIESQTLHAKYMMIINIVSRFNRQRGLHHELSILL